MSSRPAAHLDSQKLAAENESLSRELERYRAIIEQLHLNVYMYHLEDEADDHTLRIVGANAHTEATTGRPVETLIGTTLDESFPETRMMGLPQTYAQVVRSGVPFETEVVAGEGQAASAWTIHALPLPNGEVASVFENFTPRWKAEQELRQLNERLSQSQRTLQTIIDSLPSAIFWKDRNSIFEGCNLVFARSAGLQSTAEVVGKSDYDMPWKPAEADSYRAHDRNVMEAGEPELHIIEALHAADGSDRWIDTSKIPLRDSAGQVVGILGTYDDITEQRRVQQELHENQQLLQTLFDHLPMAVILKAAGDGRFLFWNQASERLYGVKSEQVLGKTPYDLFPQEAAGLQAKDQEVFERREPDITPEETFFSEGMGAPVTVRTTRLPIYDDQGAPLYLLIFCADLTQQRLAAEERAALQLRIIEAQQDALRELSTPLLPLSKRVVLMPIIGTVDSRRAQQVMETLLEGVSSNNAELAIIDITGVQVVDTQVANAFIQAAQAAQLLGAQVMLTGIRPEVAQTLVQLGVSLEGMQSRGSLQDGIAYAFGR